MKNQILIIDSEKSYAQALGIYLERLQLEASIAANMDEFQNCLAAKKFDILLTDIYLDDTDITDTLRSLKKSDKLLEIIILSEKQFLDSAMDKMNKDALAYLKKPVNQKALAHNIAKAREFISLNKKLDKYSQKLSDLHKAQNIYKDLFDQVPCYISVQDKNLRITATNNKFQKDFGSELGKYCYEQYKHRISPCIECPVKSTFKDGKSYHTEEIVTSKSGKQYNVLTQTAPIYNDKDEIALVMEISTNITQIRELQDHLSSLGMMIGSMSHGVKGMLTALDGGIYQLETGIEKNDMNRIVRAFHNISQMSHKIRKMVLDILYYAKSRKQRYKALDAAELIQSVISTVTPIADSNNVKMELSISQSLGNMEVDPTWFQAALVNIVENAIDACTYDDNKREHIVKLQVSLKDKDTICFTIQDNGMGIDQETQEKLFTMFFTSKGSQGTGLGLFIANRVIENHGGTISISSTLNEGSIFQISIPKAKPNNRHAEESGFSLLET